MNPFKRVFLMNPIVVKEIRSRMRGPRAFITLTSILLVMGGIMYAIMQIILANSRYNTILSPQIGQSMFAALAYLVLFMICAVTPAVTAGAISSEKEKLTYEMLMATPLSSSRILWGKLISALSYVFLLLFAAVPLASIVFIFGGIELGDMAKVLIVLLTVAVTFGILGLFMSVLLGRTGRATIASFVIVIILTVGPLFLAILYTALNQGKEPPRWILAFSPISAIAAGLASITGRSGGGEVFYILSGVFNAGVSPISTTSIPRPLYHFTLPIYLIFSVILFMLSTRFLQPTRRWTIRTRELILSFGGLALLIVTIAAGFLLTANRYERAVSQDGSQNFSAPVVIEGPAAPVAIPAEKRVVVVKEPTLQTTPSPAPLKVAEVINPAQTLPVEDQAQIYAAIVRQMFTIDHTFGDQPENWKSIYIVIVTDDSIGDPSAEQGEPVVIPKPVMGTVVDKVKDLAPSITLVDSRESVSIDSKNGSIDQGEGVIFTLGNIHLQDDGTVHVSAGLYFSSLGAAGRTYILNKVEGVWKISGTTGVEWIS